MKSNHIPSSDRLWSITEDKTLRSWPPRRELEGSAPYMLAMFGMRPAVLESLAVSLPRRPTTNWLRFVVSQALLRRILWWTQCVFLAGAVAMLAYSGFGLMNGGRSG